MGSFFKRRYHSHLDEEDARSYQGRFYFLPTAKSFANIWYVTQRQLLMKKHSPIDWTIKILIPQMF